MSAPKLTAAQRLALETLASRRCLTTGDASNGLFGASGSAICALVRKGLARREFTALFNSTRYEITPAGRAALGSK